ncbi:MAG: hypothetical protein ACREEK_09705 [Bradyrhizobium sp.]
MATKGQMTGMLGTYLAAAELTYNGLVVSITSRNARGADLLAADQKYKRTWSIQVKTNRKAAGFWLLSKDYEELSSPTHIYLFINLQADARPDYYVVPSRVVKKYGTTSPVRSTGSIWYAFSRKNAEKYKEKWSVFG